MPAELPAILRWTVPGRALVFTLAAGSIACLLGEMYGLCDMRRLFFFMLLPATGLLYGIALLDRGRGDGRLWRGVAIGTLAGLAGAVAYDLFRLPFVFSDAWGLRGWGIHQMPLFKVFPRFGALILGQPIEQGVSPGRPGSAWGAGFSLAAQLLGWLYHFSNGATFGVMFAALRAGSTEPAAPPQKRGATLAWAVLMAVAIELCLLASPYAQYFSIPQTTRFVVVTLLAHLVFGLALGGWYATHVRRWPLRIATARPAAS
ncbi:MAG: hypothetical protein U1A27_07505 [Phycisphaerae bacterium]